MTPSVNREYERRLSKCWLAAPRIVVAVSCHHWLGYMRAPSATAAAHWLVARRMPASGVADQLTTHRDATCKTDKNSLLHCSVLSHVDGAGRAAIRNVAQPQSIAKYCRVGMLAGRSGRYKFRSHSCHVYAGRKVSQLAP